MKRFALAIFTLFLIFPLGAQAVSIKDCTFDTAECRCFPSDIGLFPVTSDDACYNACRGYAQEPKFSAIATWTVQCDVAGTTGIVATGTIEEEGTVQVEDSDKSEALVLGIAIPGLSFEDGDNGNYIGQYVEALYKYLLAVGGIIAVLMFMVAGLQWMTARGDASKVTQAKDRMANASFGIVLLFGAYTIGFLISPDTVIFDSLNITQIEMELYTDTMGAEGSTGGANAADCTEAVQNAIEDGTCASSEGLQSPTSGNYSCNYHFSTKSYNYARINAVDYPAPFGREARAPISGTITYIPGTIASAKESRCGNKIRISNATTSVTLCHMKDFLSNDGDALESGTTVEQGDVIGHVGGTCGGGNAPKSWSQSSRCTSTGTLCDGPYDTDDCTAQHYYESGNTSGGHVHLSFNFGGNFLTCTEEYNSR